MDNNFLVFGNDEKMKSCQKRLYELGFHGDCLNENNPESLINKYDFIILPLPTVKNNLICGTEISVERFKSILSESQTVFCGNISPDIFSCNGYSYYEKEEFLTKNSRLTAQGVLRIVLENIKTDLRFLSVAVTGYGRCGREICGILRSSGARVTSFSRRSETLVLAKNDGIQAENINNINKRISDYDIIINTVPANILIPSALNKNSVYIEVASKPYGINIANEDKFDFRFVPAEGLPGKFSPVSAGYNIAETVAGIIKEGIKI